MGDKRRLLEDELGNEFENEKNDYLGHDVGPEATGMAVPTEQDGQSDNT